MPILQQKAIKALVSVSLRWSNAIAIMGGVVELSNVILESNPPLPHVLWESMTYVLSTILQFNSQHYLEVHVVVLLNMVFSSSETTNVGALNALLVLETDDAYNVETIAESSAIEALLELLRCHECEEATGRLLESLLNNVKIKDLKVAKSTISMLSQYLLDPQT